MPMSVDFGWRLLFHFDVLNDWAEVGFDLEVVSNLHSLLVYHFLRVVLRGVLLVVSCWVTSGDWCLLVDLLGYFDELWITSADLRVDTRLRIWFRDHLVLHYNICSVQFVYLLRSWIPRQDLLVLTIGSLTSLRLLWRLKLLRVDDLTLCLLNSLESLAD